MEEFKIVELFSHTNIAANGNAIGPPGGLDLSGYKDFRLVLRFDGTAGAKFEINELYGPAGQVAQLNMDIDQGQINTLGSLNYRRKFEIYGPKSFAIRVFNRSATAMKVSGSLYAVK